MTSPNAKGSARTSVLWLVKTMNRGGTETLLATMAPLIHGRVDLTVAFLQADNAELTGVFEQVRHIGSEGILGKAWPLRLAALLREAHFDIVHSHSPILASAARVVAQTVRPRPTLVTTQHSNIQHYRTVTRLIDCATSFLDDLHIAVSEDARRSLPPWMRRRTQVLIHGIDRQRFRDSALPRDVARQSLDIPPDAYLIATVANLRAVKGYRTLLRAAARVAEWNSNVVFLAVGDGPERRGLEQDRDSLGLGQQFRFLGRRTDVATVLRSADLFVLASESEGLPVSLMEALTMGLPVVGSDVGGIPEIISQEVGVLVPPSQPDLLAAGLISLLSDPGRLERMQRAALQESERLEARLAVDLLIAGYSVALEQNPRRPGLRP